MVFLVMDLRQDTDINGRQKNTSTIIQMHIGSLEEANVNGLHKPVNRLNLSTDST